MPAANRDPRQRWLMTLSIVIALALTALPLPGVMAPLRPDWVILVVIYWCLFGPGNAGVLLIFFTGLMLDVLNATILGQHAMAFVITSYLPLLLHLRMRVFSWIQLTAAIFGLLLVYQFILFWINGVAGDSTPLIHYWAPVLTGTLIWPVVMLLLDGMRLRTAGP